MSKKTVLLGAMAGLAIGALAGILLAPEKGSKTRKQIMNKGDDYVSGFKTKVSDLKNSITSKVKDTGNDVKNLAEKSKSRFDEAREETTSLASNHKMDGAADGKRSSW